MIKVENVGQGCYKRNLPEAVFMEVEVPELSVPHLRVSNTEEWDTVQQSLGSKQMYKIDKEVWNTGQQTHMDEHTEANHELVDGTAFFGWCTIFLGTNAGDGALNKEVHASQDMRAHDGPKQQHDFRGLLGADRGRPQRGESQHLTRQAGHRVGQRAGYAHHHQAHQVIRQTDRSPEDVHGNEDVPGCEEVAGCDNSSGSEDRDLHDDIALKSSFRNRYEQKSSVLEGGGASLGVKCRLHVKQNIVSCSVTFRYSKWGEIHAHIDTLNGQPPDLVRRGWGEVVTKVL